MVGPKRETNGQYAFDGNLARMCVCGHELGVHGAGSPADCLAYSLSATERFKLFGNASTECSCQKFRLSRKKAK